MPLYPALMSMPALTPEARAQLDALATRKIDEGLTALADASETLGHATSAGDHRGMQAAASEMRRALGTLEAGLAARRVLEEGTPPRNLALEWFRREMNLSTPVVAEPPRRFWGVSPLHLLTMVLLVGFSLAMVATYFVRMRRAAELLGKIAGEGGGSATTPVAGMAPATAVPPAPGPVAAAIPAVAGMAPATAVPPAPGPVAAATTPALPGCCVTPLRQASGAWRGKLRVAAIADETAAVKTFRLMMPGDEGIPFTFAPGQYLNASATIAGERQTRAYTIASSPTQRDYVEITVKREEHGVFSRHLHDAVKVGDLLDVAGPNGSFVFTGREADSVVLVAGGVGITPMMSIIRFLCDRSWPGEIFLVYACRSPKDFVFRDELVALGRRNPRLQVVATMARVEGTEWMGARGHIGKDLLVQSVPDLASRRIHVCGPPPMMDAVKAILGELGVPKDHINTEAFGAPPIVRPPTIVASVVSPPAAAAATSEAPMVTFARSNRIARIHQGKTVLELADELGVDIDNQCRVGTCGRCKVKLLTGRVTMEVEDALDDADRQAGVVLACQARPTTDIAVEA